MDARVAAHLRLNIVLRRAKKSPPDRSLSVADWFYIVDLTPTSTDGPHVLENGSVVLCFSATEADADAAATLEGIGVVHYAQLSEVDRRTLREQVQRYLQARSPNGIPGHVRE